MELFKMPGVIPYEFNRNDCIIRQGDKVDYLYYLVSGTVYRIMITEKGDEIIFEVRDSKTAKNPMQAFIGVLVLYSSGTSTNHFVAKSKCYGYKIPKEVFLKYVQDKPDMLTDLLHLAMCEYHRVTSSLQARQEGKVANRLCDFLLKNLVKDQGQLLIGKKYNNAEISRFLGIHKVTVARILKALKEEGIILKDKEGIKILDEKKLEMYAKADRSLAYKKECHKTEHLQSV